MKKRTLKIIILMFVIMASGCLRSIGPGNVKDSDILINFNNKANFGSVILKEGWNVASSSNINDDGGALSEPGYLTSGWYIASIPKTVMAVLVDNGVYKAPYFGKNLADIPGVNPHGLDVSAVAMPPNSPFRDSWWYRTEFEIVDMGNGSRFWIDFKGINYRANIWLNGSKLADSKDVCGTYRQYEFEVTNFLKEGRNALAVEVFAPRNKDLAFSWVDWNPVSPDRNMGIWRDVVLRKSGPVAVRYPHVTSDLPLPDTDMADLTVSADLVNALDRQIKGSLTGAIENIQFSKEVVLSPNETKTVVISKTDCPKLHIQNPRLWWPAKVGEQNLYDLGIEFVIDGEVSDMQKTRFGIREITYVIEEPNSRVFSINGERVLIRGAGWAPDMMLRSDPDRIKTELKYVADMNLNTVRLEGKHEVDRFYELCDEIGILVIAGWCCCHHWEHWRKWDKEDYLVAKLSQHDQVRRVRNHPCMLAWMNGSDNPPPPDVEKMYLKVLDDLGWNNPTISSATETPTKISGKSGVKMTGPYEYVPPVYWYQDKKRGGAHGFNTETSPGPAIPPIESLVQMLPPEHLWPIDDYWNFHAGRSQFADIEIFSRALDQRYGKSVSAKDFSIKSQAMTYEGQRAMFEAFGRNKYEATGVIQWMLNDAWPSIIWHLYDYYLRPAGGYFGTKKACEPLHIQYSYDDRSVMIVNSLYEDFKDLKARAVVYDIEMNEKFNLEKIVDVQKDAVAFVLTVPKTDDISDTYFLRLTLLGKSGEERSDNFYWLSKKPDEMSWAGSTWYYTPVKSYADMKDLQELPKVDLDAVALIEKNGKVNITIKNSGNSLAFMVRLRMIDGVSKEEILPVFWDDNYFSLLPGEMKTIAAEYQTDFVSNQKTMINISGWNINDQSVGLDE